MTLLQPSYNKILLDAMTYDVGQVGSMETWGLEGCFMGEKWLIDFWEQMIFGTIGYLKQLFLRLVFEKYRGLKILMRESVLV